jgi:hypothetical protein
MLAKLLGHADYTENVKGSELELLEEVGQKLLERVTLARKYWQLVEQGAGAEVLENVKRMMGELAVKL